jgi:uncharacterized membrane protein
LAVIDWIRQALQPHFHLGWNLFLALMPLVLAVWLFRRIERRSVLWWPVFAVFIIFLPNAAYTLTDVIHFVAEVQQSDSFPTWSVVYIIIPKYALFMFLGFQSHVLSLILLGNYLRWVGHKRWVHPVEIALNLLCAVGVYWGRYLRFNSWEVFSKPQRIADQVLKGLMMEGLGYSIILWYFVGITSLYFAVKIIDIAVWEYWQRRRLQGLFPARVTAWIPRRKPDVPAENEVVES